MNASDCLVHHLLSSFNQYQQVMQGKRVWLACSGGRDSLSLALVCRQLFEDGHLPFLPQLLHVDHGIQDVNKAWSDQVGVWAKQHDMPCRVLSLTLKDKSEQSARQARYKAMMAEMNYDDVLMLGHHQDDQVETVLMRLFNGSGVNGLSGMQPWRFKLCSDPLVRDNPASELASQPNSQPHVAIQPSKKGVYLWRPWLNVSRALITAYAQSMSLDYIDDPSNIIDAEAQAKGSFKDSVNSPVIHNQAINESTPCTPRIHSDDNDHSEHATANQVCNDRAWLRSELMPLILARYPSAQTSIARSSHLMQDASHIIKERVEADLAEILFSDTLWQSVMDINELRTLSNQRQSAIIHQWLTPSIEELPPSKRLVDEVLSLSSRIDNNHQTLLNCDTGLHHYEIRRYQDKLYRLQLIWLNWLSVKPKTLQLEVSVNDYETIPQSVNLKPDNTEFVWCLEGIDKVIGRVVDWLSGQIDAEVGASNPPLDNIRSTSTKVKIIIEPLPRDLKINLAVDAKAARVGRKAGKKLLQAIHQPSFMRESVMICSLAQAKTQSSIPLFIITVDKVIAIDSPLLEQVHSLIINNDIQSVVKPLTGNFKAI